MERSYPWGEPRDDDYPHGQGKEVCPPESRCAICWPETGPAERCECDAFNQAVNDETIFWDTASEDESGTWRVSSDEYEAINFCPFCGKLVPLTAHFQPDAAAEKPGFDFTIQTNEEPPKVLATFGAGEAK
jgi:hypothetical protein